MADVTVDRLVVLIEAQTRSFETQIRKLEGQINTSSRRMTGSFKGLNTQVSQMGTTFGRVFGIGGIGRGGLVGALVAATYGVNRLANSMANLRKDAKEAGVALDDSLGDAAERFNEKWDDALSRLSVSLRKAVIGGYSFADIFNGRIEADLGPSSKQRAVGARGDLGTMSRSFTEWDKTDAIIEDLTKSFEKLRDAANDAAQGMTDSVQDFTHAIIDNPRDWAGALTNMLKGSATSIVDAGLFGTGPYAKLMGTAGPGPGGPGGLVGDAFGALMGHRSFGGHDVVPVTIVGVEGSGAMNLLGSFTGGIGGKDQSRIGWVGQTAAAAATGTVNPSFLDMISKAEGTGGPNGYNTSLGYGRFLPGGAEQNLTSMTLDQIRGLQSGMLNNPANTLNSSAIGRYQITRSTLDDLRTKLGLSGSELYDPAMQDALALNLAQQRGPGAMTSTWAGLGQQSPGFLAQLLAMFPHFASGGRFSAGHPFIAGERGPEMVVPNAPGSVIPNGGMGGITIIDKRTNAPPIQQRGNTLVVADHDKLMRSRYGIKPTQVGRT